MDMGAEWEGGEGMVVEKCIALLQSTLSSHSSFLFSV